jgi:hypothetical protein
MDNRGGRQRRGKEEVQIPKNKISKTDINKFSFGWIKLVTYQILKRIRGNNDFL